MYVKPVATQSVHNQVSRLLDGQYKSDKPFRTLLLILQGQKKSLAISSLLYLVKQSPVYVLPLATKGIIDAVSKHSQHSTNNAIFWCVLAAICILQNTPMHTLYTRFMSGVNRQTQRDMRSALIIRLQQLTLAYHDENEVGRMQSKVMRDVDNIGGVLKSGFETILSTVTILGFSMAIAIVQAPVVAAFFVLTIPVGVGLMQYFRAALKERNHKYRKEFEGVSVRVNEMIEMLPITRAHAAETLEVSRVRRRLGRYTATGRRLDVTTELFASSSWVTFQLFQFSCLIFCAFLVYHGRLTVGQLVMFQAYFGMILGQVSGVIGMLPQITAGAESIRSLGEILESDELEDHDGKLQVADLKGGITFENVTFTYPGGTEPAIQNFTLDIAPGECVALVGESGSGKSTLTNLILGFRHPEQGKILLDGINMEQINPRSYRRLLSIVPQNTLLFSGTVRENVAYGLENITDRQVEEALERANCTEFVARMADGVETKIGPRGAKLSGGQRQRLAIARALLRDPRMLILDEATSALDAYSEHHVQKAIQEVIEGRTTIMIAHRLSTLKAADRIIVLDHGHIVEQGSWKELLALNGRFAKAYAMQTSLAMAA